MNIEDAIRIARLWRDGKMIGADEDDVRDALLAEVESLRDAIKKAARGETIPLIINGEPVSLDRPASQE